MQPGAEGLMQSTMGVAAARRHDRDLAGRPVMATRAAVTEARRRRSFRRFLRHPILRALPYAPQYVARQARLTKLEQLALLEAHVIVQALPQCRQIDGFAARSPRGTIAQRGVILQGALKQRQRVATQCPEPNQQRFLLDAEMRLDINREPRQQVCPRPIGLLGAPPRLAQRSGQDQCAIVIAREFNQPWIALHGPTYRLPCRERTRNRSPCDARGQGSPIEFGSGAGTKLALRERPPA